MKNWIEDIDEITENFSESFGELSYDQLNWKPNSDTWSIAQNIEHLIIINDTYFNLVESIRKGTHQSSFLSKVGFLVSFFGNTILKLVQPDRKKKIKTFPIWEPPKSEIPKDILDRFETHQAQLKKIIEDSRDLVEKGVIISSPANKHIVYTLEKAFDIIVSHEKRHFNQARELYQILPR